MLVLSNEDIEQLISMEDCIDIIEQAYRDFAHGLALNSPRVDNISPCSSDDAFYAFKHMGGTWPARQIQALRINSDIVTHPTIAGKQRRVKVPLANGRWVGLVELFSTETGELLAIFPDGVAQRMRVGATNGLAAKYLARPESFRVGMIGAGWQAGAQLMAILAVRPVTEINVYSPRQESREAFARDAERMGITVTLVDNPEQCVRDADIIIAATSSMTPVIDPSWLRPGVHLSCIKAQELDRAVIEACGRTVVHTKHQAKQMNNIMPGTPNLTRETVDGWWNQEGMRWGDFADLADLLVGRASAREHETEISCFVNNVGLGLQFAAVGALILERARSRGLGHELPSEWFTESVHP